MGTLSSFVSWLKPAQVAVEPAPAPVAIPVVNSTHVIEEHLSPTEVPPLLPPPTVPVKPSFMPRLERQIGPETVKRIVDAAQPMPAFPTSALQVMNEINSIDASPARIASAVRLDPVLTAAVLRVANTPLYSPSRAITNLEAAIITLGLETLHSVVIQNALAGVVQSRGQKGGYDVQALWEHSVAASVYAGTLARKCRNVHPSEAVTAALLHDLGKVVVNVYCLDRVREVLDTTTTRLGESLLSKEQRLLDAAHTVYGAILARRWGLPDPLALAIELHHHTASHTFNEFTPRVKELAAVVFAANQFAKLSGYCGNDAEIDWAEPGLLEQIGLQGDILTAYKTQPDMLHTKVKVLVGK